MISLNYYKKLLGSYADEKSDDELMALLSMQYKLAGISIDLWESENIVQINKIRDNSFEPQQ